MKMHSIITLALVSLSATPAIQAQPADPAAPDAVREPLVVELGVAGQAPDLEADSVAVMRSRAMNIEAAALYGLAHGDQVLFNLFDDTTFTGVLEELDERSPERFVWQGKLLEDGAGRFLLSVWEDAVHIDIQGPDAKTYVVRGVPQRPDLRGTFIAREVDTSKLGGCRDALSAPSAPAQGPQDADHEHDHALDEPTTDAADPRESDDPGVELNVIAPTTSDIAVYWTQQAQNGAGGLTSLFAAINGAVADTNTTMANSMTHGRNPARIRWVSGNLIANYTESGDDLTELNRFTNQFDGFFDFVHAERNTFGIDLMVMIGEHARPFTCGVAWMPNTVTSGNSHLGFSFTKRDCLGGLNAGTFAHELGHNFGLAHDRQNSTSSPAFTYGYGYRWFGILYRDTMAYEPGIRQQIYSNPNLYIGGVQGDNNFRAGIPIGQPGEADASTAMSNANPAITAYRERPTRTYMQYTGQAAGSGVPVDVFRTLGHAQANQPTGWSLWINGISRVNENLLLNRPMLLERWPGTGTVLIGRP